MKTGYFSMSMRVGAPVFGKVAKRRPEVAAAGAPATLQNREGTGRTPKHPGRILAEELCLAAETES